MKINNKIKIYNSLTRKKDLIKPKTGKKLNLFFCGPTVYDFPHMGHARSYVIFDCFVKYLKFLGFNVFYLQNITNIDDKIIMRARERGVPAKDLAIAFEKEHLKYMKILKVDSVSKYARATDFIKEIISQVERLLEKGFAYEIPEKGIYFNIAKFKNYGKLSGRTTSSADDSLSRIDYNKDKINRGDFCLWKFSDPGEPQWKSPWGAGRPGWHIEDTAITEKFFGAQYDIHGGGRDLIFPHHEAEISQMEAISGKKPLAKYWMHTGFLTINGQKMSKSLGNFITISDFLQRYSAQQLRFLIVKNLWRSPLDYSESAMIEVKAALEKIEEFVHKIQISKSKFQNKSKLKNSNFFKNIFLRARSNFYKQLNDDFNTPKAFAVLFDFIKDANKFLEQDLKPGIKRPSMPGFDTCHKIYKFFEEINQIFGIINFKKINQKIPVKIQKLVKLRETFRKQQNWQKSDQLRQEIEGQGFAVEDTKIDAIVKRI